PRLASCGGSALRQAQGPIPTPTPNTAPRCPEPLGAWPLLEPDAVFYPTVRSEEGDLGGEGASGGAGILGKVGDRRRVPLRVAVLVDQLRADALDHVGVRAEPHHAAVLPLQRLAHAAHPPR